MKRFPFPGEAKEIRCSTDARLQSRALDCEQRKVTIRRSLMQEESLWRYALAQQVASHAHANPKVAAVLVEGSVARGYADRFSDIDLAVFWAEPPTKEERREVSERAGGSHWHPLPSDHEGSWSEHYDVGGVSIDVRHMTVEATERILAD